MVDVTTLAVQALGILEESLRGNSRLPDLPYNVQLGRFGPAGALFP